MADLPFIDSFDHYTQAQAGWKYSSGGPVLAPGEGTFGTTGATQFASLIDFTTPQSNVGFAMHIRSLAASTPGTDIPGGLQIFTLQNTISGFLAIFFWSDDGRIGIRVSNANDVYTGMNRTMHTQTWHHVAGVITIHASPTPPSPPHTFDLVINIDGLEVLNVAGLQSLATTLDVAFMRGGSGGGISGLNQVRDDFAITNGVIYGPGNIIRLEPTADETIQWAEPAFPTPHYQQIDEPICDLADFIATNTPGNLDRFNGQAVPANIIGDPFVLQSVFYGVGADKIYHVLNTDEFQGVYNAFSTHPETGRTAAYVSSLLHGVKYNV